MPKTKVKSRLRISVPTKAKAKTKLVRLPPPPSPEFINRINAIDSTFGQTKNLGSRSVKPSLKKTRHLQVKLDTGPITPPVQPVHDTVQNADVDQRILDLKRFGDDYLKTHENTMTEQEKSWFLDDLKQSIEFLRKRSGTDSTKVDSASSPSPKTPPPTMVDNGHVQAQAFERLQSDARTDAVDRVRRSAEREMFDTRLAIGKETETLVSEAVEQTKAQHLLQIEDLRERLKREQSERINIRLQELEMEQAEKIKQLHQHYRREEEEAIRSAQKSLRARYEKHVKQHELAARQALSIRLKAMKDVIREQTESTLNELSLRQERELEEQSSKLNAESEAAIVQKQTALHARHEEELQRRLAQRRRVFSEKQILLIENERKRFERDFEQQLQAVTDEIKTDTAVKLKTLEQEFADLTETACLEAKANAQEESYAELAQTKRKLEVDAEAKERQVRKEMAQRRHKQIEAVRTKLLKEHQDNLASLYKSEKAQNDAKVEKFKAELMNELEDEIQLEKKRLEVNRIEEMQSMRDEHERKKAEALHDLQVQLLSGSCSSTHGDEGDELEELRRELNSDLLEHEKVKTLLERLCSTKLEVVRLRTQLKDKQCKACSALLAYNAELITRGSGPESTRRS